MNDLKTAINGSRKFSYVEDMFEADGPLSGYTQKDYHERIDYFNDVVAVSPDNDVIIVRTYGGSWGGDHQIITANYVAEK